MTYHLKIGETPNYPHIGTTFSIPIYLYDEKNQLKCGVDITLTAKLFFDEKPPLRECDAGILEIEDPPTSLKITSKTGTTNVRVKLNEVSYKFGNKKFLLHFSGVSSTGGHIDPAITRGMLAIKHRLVFRSVEPMQTGWVWYKDEGGREKTIEMYVHLVDAYDNIVTGRKFPLKLGLLYESGQLVPKQDILKINHDSRLMIDETGRTLLRFRIDEVSRSHQKQLFRVQVSPDTINHPLASDVSPDMTVPMEIRSKRNNPKTTTSRFSTGGRPNDTDGILDRPTKYQKATDLNMADHGLPTLAATAEVLGSSYQSSSNTTVFSGESIYHAVSGLVSWSETVNQGIEKVSWRQYGHEVNQEGEIDPNRPLYSIQNPTNVFQEIKTQYRQHVVHCLSHLLSFVEFHQRQRPSQPSPTVVQDSYQQGNNSSSTTTTANTAVMGSNGIHESYTYNPDLLPGGPNPGSSHYQTFKSDVSSSSGNIVAQTDPASAYIESESDDGGRTSPVPTFLDRSRSEIFMSMTMPSFSRSNTLDNSLDFLIDGLYSYDIDQVWYIVGTLYVSLYQQRQLGFPGAPTSIIKFVIQLPVAKKEPLYVHTVAFNKSEELLGFYREQQGSGQTEIPLVTVAEAKLNGEVSDDDLRILSFQKIESGESYSTNIFSRDRYETLERMREDVLINHWNGL